MWMPNTSTIQNGQFCSLAKFYLNIIGVNFLAYTRGVNLIDTSAQIDCHSRAFQ